MAFLWGSTALNVIKDTYIPPFAEITLNETKLLPGSDNLVPGTVLQQGGRGRYTVKFNILFYDYANYQALLDDYINQTERTFTGADSYTATMTISSLSQAVRKLFPTRFEFSIELMEV